MLCDCNFFYSAFVVERENTSIVVAIVVAISKHDESLKIYIYFFTAATLFQLTQFINKLAPKLHILIMSPKDFFF